MEGEEGSRAAAAPLMQNFHTFMFPTLTAKHRTHSVASQALSGRLAAASLVMHEITDAGLDRWLSTGIRLCSPGLMTRNTWQGGDGGGGIGTLLGAIWYCCLGWKLVRAVGRDARYLSGVWNNQGVELETTIRPSKISLGPIYKAQRGTFHKKRNRSYPSLSLLHCLQET